MTTVLFAPDSFKGSLTSVQVARDIAESKSLINKVRDPSARIAPGYEVASVTSNGGGTLRGFARSRGSHDVQVQSFDGKLHLLNDGEY